MQLFIGYSNYGSNCAKNGFAPFEILWGNSPSHRNAASTLKRLTRRVRHDANNSLRSQTVRQLRKRNPCGNGNQKMLGRDLRFQADGNVQQRLRLNGEDDASAFVEQLIRL